MIVAGRLDEATAAMADRRMNRVIIVGEIDVFASESSWGRLEKVVVD